MSWFQLTYFTIIALYLLGGVLFVAGLLGRKSGLKRASMTLSILGFVLHSLLMTHFLVNYSYDALDRGFYIRMLSWSVVAAFFLAWWRLKLDFLELIVSPVALLAFISSLAMPGVDTAMGQSLSGVLFYVHIACVFATMALLVMAFGAALLFMHQEKRIKTKQRISGFQKDLPALSTFDRINQWAIVIGFPLFTLGLIVSFLGVHFSFAKLITWLSLIIWLLYACLFQLRVVHGWQGRKPAQGVIVLFALILCAMFINFVIPASQGFHP